MKLLSIELNDFLAYAGKHGLDFSNIQSAVICGPNEAGKSSLIDAILYALSGQARKRPEELINETADKYAAGFLLWDDSKEGPWYEIQNYIDSFKFYGR